MDKTPPTVKEIDTAAQLYVDAQASADQAQESANVLKDNLQTMVKDHGFIPRRATKSRRLEGEKWKVTLSKGHKVEVKSGAAMKLREALRLVGLLRFFRKLFVREQIYVLADGAQELMAKPLPAKAPETIRMLFADAVAIESQSPTLKVEPIKKEEE